MRDPEFRGTNQHIIHPGTALLIFALENTPNLHTELPANIEYRMAALDVPLAKGVLTIGRGPD